VNLNEKIESHLQHEQTLFQAEDALAQARLAALAGDCQSLSSTRRRLAAQAGGRCGASGCRVDGILSGFPITFVFYYVTLVFC
jgi:hypothetical protein